MSDAFRCTLFLAVARSAQGGLTRRPLAGYKHAGAHTYCGGLLPFNPKHDHRGQSAFRGYRCAACPASPCAASHQRQWRVRRRCSLACCYVAMSNNKLVPALSEYRGGHDACSMAVGSSRQCRIYLDSFSCACCVWTSPGRDSLHMFGPQSRRRLLVTKTGSWAHATPRTGSVMDMASHCIRRR